MPAAGEAATAVALADDLNRAEVRAALASFSPQSEQAPGAHRRRRLLLRLAGVVAFVLLCIPVATWLHYQSVNVISRNAVTRGELIEIGTRLDGVLATTEVSPGSRVRAGQVLARLQQAHLRSQDEEAEAQLVAAERELAVERLAIPQEERMLDSQSAQAVAMSLAAESNAHAARSESADADAFYAARQALLKRSAISREEVRNADTKRQMLRAMLEFARANLAAARSAARTANIQRDGLAIRQQRIGVFEANVSRARARLAQTKAELEASIVRAPSDGGVIRWLIQRGGSVKAGLPILAMWAGDDVWIEAWIDEDEIARVRIGDAARVTLASSPGQEFRGVVEQIGMTTDYELPLSSVPEPRTTRMRGAPEVGVIVRLDAPPPGMLPGMSAEVAVQVRAQ